MDNPVVLIFAGIVFVIVGFLLLFKTEKMLKWFASTRFDNEVEPSYSYISSTKFGGIVLIIIGVCIIIVMILILLGVIN